MKNISPKFFSFLCISILCISATYSQESETETPTIEQKEYVVEKVDSINKSKDAIYSSTKMFIAQNWKSAQNVIQNDDKVSIPV